MQKIKDRTGEKRTMNCGLEATIIRYGSCHDIDVQFEDGQVVYHSYYSSFKKGEIAPPIDPRYSHVGEKRMMNCGLEATIIRYGGSMDIDVQFEDGQVVYKRTYDNFQKGSIGHPCFTASNGHSSTYKTFIIKYVDRSPATNEPYYLCKCQKCGYEIIDTAKNIIKLKHKCEITAT